VRGIKTFRKRFNLETMESENVPVYTIDGNEVSAEEFEAEFPEQRIRVGEDYRPCTFKPIASEALAYHPKQIPEAKEHFQKLGIGDTEIDSTGRPVFRDRQHRRRVLRALGKIDRNSFSGY
jgi:NAD+--asparagine ADP-ribosyltransferase